MRAADRTQPNNTKRANLCYNCILDLLRQLQKLWITMRAFKAPGVSLIFLKPLTTAKTLEVVSIFSLH